jgi:hypothetical protein
MMNWIASAYEDRRNPLDAFIGMARFCADDIQIDLPHDYGHRGYFIREINGFCSGIETLA